MADHDDDITASPLAIKILAGGADRVELVGKGALTRLRSGSDMTRKAVGNVVPGMKFVAPTREKELKKKSKQMVTMATDVEVREYDSTVSAHRHCRFTRSFDCTNSTLSEEVLTRRRRRHSHRTRRSST